MLHAPIKRWAFVIRFELGAYFIAVVDEWNTGQRELQRTRELRHLKTVPGDEAFSRVVVVEETHDQRIGREAAPFVRERGTKTSDIDVSIDEYIVPRPLTQAIRPIVRGVEAVRDGVGIARRRLGE